MNVSEAVTARISIRAFKSDPVEEATIRKLLEQARYAPSGGNLQPWRVMVATGEPLAEIKRRAIAAPEGSTPAHDVYPADLWEPFRTRRYVCGEDLYGSIGLPREDKEGRRRQLARNAALFGAPVGLFIFIDHGLGVAQWADVGIFLQTLMLLATAEGLDSCPQAFWARRHQVVAEVLGVPPEFTLYAGLALGYREVDAPINQLRTRRESVEAFAEFRGF